MDPHSAFMEFYDRALPSVYGYLSSRCRPVAAAQDLTADTFLAAVDAARRNDPNAVNLPWVMGVARHKLIDHWRRQDRQEKRITLLAGDASADLDPWNVHLDALRAREVLDELAPHHRAALTFRYLDDLSVPEVAALLGRTLHATEALLTRAREAFRRAYGEEEEEGDRARV